MSTEERELKLAPHESALLELLADLRTIGPFEVVGAKLERQRNAYFDTRTRALQRAKLAFRRRVEPDEMVATWTLKADPYTRSLTSTVSLPETRTPGRLKVYPTLKRALLIAAPFV